MRETVQDGVRVTGGATAASEGDILIPGFSFSERADRLFEENGFRIHFALDEAERAAGYARADREELRQAAIGRALDSLLPRICAIKAQGSSGPLSITAELLDRAPALGVVFIGAAGVDRIDVRAATERGVVVVNAAGANAGGVAEHTLGLMLALARQISEADRRAHRDHKPVPRDQLMGGDLPLSTLAGKIVGVIGLGAIGREVARLCQAFRMQVVGYDPAPRSGLADVDRVTTDLDELIQAADVVTLHAPLVAETRSLIDAGRLGLMKPTAILINTSRGELVDTDALVECLRRGSIRAAGLDVTDPEPLPEGHPLFSFPNVVLTPHSAGVSPEMVEALAYKAAAGAVDVLLGKLPATAVNPEAWDRHQERFGSSRAVEER